MPPKRTVRSATARPRTRSLGVAAGGRGAGAARGRDAEVAVAHLVALRQVGGAAGQRDAADLEHDGLVGDAERHRGVLLDEHDGHALAVDLLDHLGELGDDPRRETQRRLVEQQHARRGHQRAADREHLLLAAGQQAGALARALAEDREQLGHAGPRALARRLVARRQPAGAQVLLHRQVREDAPALRHVHEPAARDPRRVHADEAAARELDRAAGDRAALRRERPGDRPQQRALTGAVAAEHGDDRALGHLERDAPQGLHRARVAAPTARARPAARRPANDVPSPELPAQSPPHLSPRGRCHEDIRRPDYRGRTPRRAGTRS